jgi:hypothetical protein
MKRLFFILGKAASIICLLGHSPVSRATMEITAWVPIFKGIEHATGTNTPGGGFNDLNIVNAIKVDLRDPDLRLFATPQITNYAAGFRETAGYTVPEFLKVNNLQLAVNGDRFDPSQYYLPAGTPMDVHGLTISEGIVVSQPDSTDASTVLFDINRNASIIHTNYPSTNTAGIYTAISGTYPILIKGTNVGARYANDPDFIHEVNPRTLFGLSEDRRYLYIMAIDGRHPGYSNGADDIEAAAWMKFIGAYDAVNLDGGGSTCLAIQDSIGNPITLNKSNAFADSGKERTVGSHFGIYAKRVPGFVNDIVVTPEDHSATIQWTTIEAGSGGVEYGLTTDFGTAIAANATEGTNYTTVLSNLTANTPYFFKIGVTNANTNYLSELFTFTTTNHVTLKEIFPLTTSWKYSTANLDGAAWTTKTYTEPGWLTGNGLLYAVQNGRTINGAVQPLGHQMAASPATGYPYRTYYLRKHFTYSTNAPAEYFNLSAFIDDGAVIYLNGHELRRIRMPDAPAAIDNITLATATPCAGDATCSDDFSISSSELAYLEEGDNVIAVEVHNNRSNSPDIVFGMSLVEADPIVKVIAPTIVTSVESSQLKIEWSGTGFILQQTDSLGADWQDVQPTVSSSPYSTDFIGTAKFFRLRSQ